MLTKQIHSTNGDNMVRKIEVLEYIRIRGGECPTSEINRFFIKEGISTPRTSIYIILRRLIESGLLEKFKKDGRVHVRFTDRVYRWLKAKNAKSFYDIPRDDEKKGFRKPIEFHILDR